MTDFEGWIENRPLDAVIQDVWQGIRHLIANASGESDVLRIFSDGEQVTLECDGEAWPGERLASLPFLDQFSRFGPSVQKLHASPSATTPLID